jgi:sugar-phosphatase
MTPFGRTFAAILFDLDGTLVDSTAAVERSWRRWAAEFGVYMPELPHGLPSRDTVARSLPADRLEVGAQYIEDLELTDTEGVIALPGAREALVALSGGSAAIVTSCTAALATARLRAADLTPPDIVVTADQLRRGKPDPEGYLLAAHRLGLDPADCLAIEDAPGGLAAATAAGCATVALTTTTAASDLVADAVIGTLADLELLRTVDGVFVHAC